MNKVILMGRLVRDPDVRTHNETSIARYTLAVDRKYKRDGEASADFINCVVFGKSAEFTEKYLHKGTKIAVAGRIQTGSYTNRDGMKVYTTDIIVEEQEFAESKAASAGTPVTPPPPSPYGSLPTDENGFICIPDVIDDEELPF